MNSHNPPAQDPLLETNGLEWELFWHHNKKKILLGSLILLLGAGIFIAWYVSTVVTGNAAQEALADANETPALEAIVKKYPKTTAAADALLLIAAAHREQRKMQESTAAFQKFLEMFPEHPLAGGALLGIGENFDASGDSQKAINIYQQVGVQYPKSYAAPLARYSEAEILLREFRRDEARRVLDDIVTQFPQSQVAHLAAAQLSRVNISFEPAPAQ